MKLCPKTPKKYIKGIIIFINDHEDRLEKIIRVREEMSQDTAEEASKEMIAWLERTGRLFPVDQEPLLQAIFRQVNFTKEDISYFGLKLLAFKEQLQKITIFDVVNTIIKSRDPYKKDWEKLEALPTNLRAITRRFLIINFIIESLLTVDFSKPNMTNFWHEITYSILAEYMTLTETIRTLSIFYWEKFFVKDFYRDVTPLINYYRDIFTQKLIKNLAAIKENPNSELFRTYAGYLIQIWTIIDRYNNVTIKEFQIPDHWVFETLYKEIIPRVEDEFSFFTKLTPLILMKFFTKSLEMSNLFTEQEKNQNIINVQQKFTKKASQEFYTIAVEQLKAHQVIQSILSTTWALYYLNIAKEVTIENLGMLKQKWTEYYLLLLKNTFPQELLLLHFAFVFKSLKTDNLSLKLKKFILEATVFTEVDSKNLNLPEQKQELQDIEKALRNLEPQIEEINNVLEIYLPIWQTIVQQYSDKLGYLSKKLVQYALQMVENFSNNVENPPILFNDEKERPRFINNEHRQIGILAPLDSVVNQIIMIIEGLGMKNIGDIQKRKHGTQKGIETKFGGSIAGITLELTYILMTYDGQQCSIEWNLKWTTPPANQPMDEFINWITIFHYIILRNIVRELNITRTEKQQCTNCNEWLELKQKDNTDIIICQNCRYPNLILRDQF